MPGPLADQRIVVGVGPAGLAVAGSQQSVLVLGPPRSGKTSSLVIPNVLAAWGPVVSTSTKPDVALATFDARRRRGRCWLYDPSGTVPVPQGMSELRWSPVTAAGTWDGALLMARAVVGAARPASTGAGHVSEADHWTERAEALLAPLLFAASLGGDDATAVLGWVNRRDGRTAAARLKGTGTAQDLLAGILATEARELSGIWSTASGALAAYRSDAALRSAESPNFDAARFVASGDTVYVCASGRHQDLVAPLVVGLVEDVRGAAFARAAARFAHGPDGGPVEAPVMFALDEVANVAPLPDLPSLVSEGGGQGVLTMACLQDLSQARRRWGQAAEGFGSLFGATVVLPGIGDVRTLEALSVLCGSVDVWVQAQSRSGWAHPRSETWSTRRQRRLTPDEVARGWPGHGLLVGGGRPPSWTPLAPWFSVPAWAPRARPVPERPVPERPVRVRAAPSRWSGREGPRR